MIRISFDSKAHPKQNSPIQQGVLCAYGWCSILSEVRMLSLDFNDRVEHNTGQIGEGYAIQKDI